MDRESARKAAEIMLAYADGKTIEVINPDNDSPWAINNNPSFNWITYDYRIKPEPKYRPFKGSEECWQEMKNHEPFGWVKTPLKYKTIDAIGTEVYVAYEGRSHTFEEAYDKFTFADGTPFGKLEDKE